MAHSAPGVVAAVIVKRSRILKPSHKLLWLEYWLLGRNVPDGWITLSQSALADRLAIPLRTVKRTCSVLERTELMQMRQSSRRAAGERRVAFPLPQTPLKIPDLDEQVRLQSALDFHIEGALRVVPDSPLSVVPRWHHSVVPKRVEPIRNGERGGERRGREGELVSSGSSVSVGRAEPLEVIDTLSNHMHPNGGKQDVTDSTGQRSRLDERSTDADRDRWKRALQA